MVHSNLYSIQITLDSLLSLCQLCVCKRHAIQLLVKVLQHIETHAILISTVSSKSIVYQMPNKKTQRYTETPQISRITRHRQKVKE